LDGKISLSLDTWTSSNGYAFLAIVAHYITNDGELGKNIPMLPLWHLKIFQRNSFWIYESSLENTLGRTWQRQFGIHLRHITSQQRYVFFA